MENTEAVVAPATPSADAPVGSEDVSDKSMKALWARAEKKAQEAEARAKDKPKEKPTARQDGRVKTREKRPEKSPEKAEEEPEADEPTVDADEPDDGQEEQDEAQKKADYDSLRQLAKKLGLKVEDDAVSIGERATFRRERRERIAQLERKEKEINDRLSAAAANLEKKYGSAMQAQELLGRADPDEIAKALGFKSFGDWTHEHVVAGNNPDRRKLRELEKMLTEQKAEAEAAKRRVQEQEEAQSRQAKQESYLDDVCSQLSEIPEMEGWADSREFALEVLNVQRRNYDPETRTTISTEDAAQEVLDNLQKAREDLNKRFGARVSPEQSPPQRRVPRTVSNVHSADAHSSGRSVPLTREEQQAEEKAWKAKWTEMLRKG